jgi:hypothetical protein
MRTRTGGSDLILMGLKFTVENILKVTDKANRGLKLR